MMYDRQEIEDLPDEFNLERLRRVIHVSKKTCAYYLQSGLIPCFHNGKRTHSYFIRKADLIAAIDRYERSPALFFNPVKGISKRKKPKNLFNYLPESGVGSATAQAYYRKKYETVSDLIDVDTIVEMTGYTHQTVNHWCNEGKLRFVSHFPKRWIAKRSLLEYLNSDFYNAISRKSVVHQQDLTNIFRELYQLPELEDPDENEVESPEDTDLQASSDCTTAEADEKAVASDADEIVPAHPVQADPVPTVNAGKTVVHVHSEPVPGRMKVPVSVKKVPPHGSPRSAVIVSHKAKDRPGVKQIRPERSGFSDNRTGIKSEFEKGFKSDKTGKPVVKNKRKVRR